MSAAQPATEMAAINIDDFTKLTDALARVIRALIWPVAICYLLTKFRADIGQLVSTVGELRPKGAGLEAIVTRQKNAAAAALTAATVSKTSPDSVAEAAKEAVETVEDLSPNSIRDISRSTVLWVDDHPEYNEFERQALEALGVRFRTATSTGEALTALGTKKFNLIISDMDRPPDSQAGYTLLEKLRSSGDQTPVMFYTSSASPEQQRDARARGALGQTDNAPALFASILEILRHQPTTAGSRAKRRLRRTKGDG